MAKDPAIKYTDEELKDLEDKIKAVYSEAESDIQKKMDDFNEKFQKKDLIYQKQLKDGLITQEDYDDWKKGQVFTGKQWAAKKNEIAATLHNSNKIATAMINGSTLSVFAENSNYTAYSLEHDAGANFGFGLYNTDSVAKLIKEDPQLLPKWKVDQKKDYIWNQKNINIALTQGIIQGESLNKISKRVSSGLAGKNQNLMNTFAKTGMTQAQNSGRLERLEKAKKLGLNVKKEWIATLDNRTRFDHQQLDGQIADTDGYFKVGGLKIRYPGDPEAHPSLVYNCRCALGNHLVDYPSKYQRYDNIDGEPIEGMTYNEWKNAKTKSKSVKPATVKKSTIVNGKDISSTWKRRPDEFNFAIEDVINAQGFDGLPRVIDPEEFDKYVKENNIIMQRGYTAPDQETLKKYQNELYDGKWYVDCSHGESAYGRGMYTAYNKGTVLEDATIDTAKAYGGGPNGVIETMTFDKSAKIINHSDVIKLLDKYEDEYKEHKDEIISNFVKNKLDESDISGIKRDYVLDRYFSISNSDTDAFGWYKSLSDDERKNLDETLKPIVFDIKNKVNDVMSEIRNLDEGTIAAMYGYDAISTGNGEHGYLVVLNRTKLIIKGE